jgi:hypothetical protein
VPSQRRLSVRWPCAWRAAAYRLSPSRPLPRPNTPACRRSPHLAPGSLARIPPHRGESPAPTPGLPKSSPEAAVPPAGCVSASSAESSASSPDILDALSCGSHALPNGPAKHAAADTQSVASPAPTPLAAFVAVHCYACSANDSSIPPSSSDRAHVAG